MPFIRTDNVGASRVSGVQWLLFRLVGKLSVDALSRVRIVMVETSLSGNIGSAARAMKTMGISDLVLVNPRETFTEQAISRASGARDVLENARVVEHLEDAVSDCQLVMGTSARSRSLPWPLVNARQAAELAFNLPATAKIALVFGRERSGLTNGELALCHQHIQIPANQDYSSLNIASAIQVLCYEFRMRALDGTASYSWENERESPPAAAGELEGFFQHLEHTLIDIGYLDPNKPKLLMSRLRRLYLRALPDSAEVNILRGILKKTGASRSDTKHSDERTDHV